MYHSFIALPGTNKDTIRKMEAQAIAGGPLGSGQSRVMQTTIESKPFEQIEADALIVPIFEGKREDRFGAGELLDAGELSGKVQEFTLLHHPAGVAAARVLMAGAGKPEKFDSAELRRVAGAAVRYLNAKSVKRIALALDPGQSGAEYVSAAMEGAILGDYEPDRYKTGNDKKAADSFAVVAQPAPGLDAAARRGQILGDAQNFTRSLVNEPANRLTPAKMAETARNMASEFHLECEVLETAQMEALGMGALLGVAQGSAEPPALIVVRYRPETAGGAAHLGLVGKGVTFDTGGISIKPADGMEKMKYDMAGGAAMLGAMRAIAQLRPPIAVTAFIGVVRHPPKSSMPTFSAKVIPDSDLRDMWAYLNTIPANPDPKSIPLLSALQ